MLRPIGYGQALPWLAEAPVASNAAATTRDIGIHSLRSIVQGYSPFTPKPQGPHLSGSATRRPCSGQAHHRLGVYPGNLRRLVANRVASPSEVVEREPRSPGLLADDLLSL